jgi:Flp pilus assembly pilin Flp
MRHISLRTLKAQLARLVADDRGGETIEYALVLGLIIVAAIAVIGAVGTRVVARWTSVNGTL